MKNIFLLFLTGAMLYSCNLKNPPAGNKTKNGAENSAVNDAHKLLQGNWVSVEDPRSELIITPGKIEDVYKHKSLSADNYIISDTCRYSTQRVKNGFLHRIDNDDTLCYEILTLTEKHLSLLYLNRGNILAYKRK